MRSQIQQWYSKMNVTTGFNSSNWSRNRLERLSNCRFQLYSGERKGADGILKIGEWAIFLHSELQKAVLSQNGGYHWIQLVILV